MRRWFVLGILVGITGLWEPVLAGLEKHSMRQNGVKRIYKLYVPDDLDMDEPCPLLIALHGGGGTAQSMVSLTRGRFNELAERDLFMVLYPGGHGRYWNDGRDIEKKYSGMDDLRFISDLITYLSNRYPVDPGRIYVTGISNGAMMTLRLACEKSELFAGAAAVAGSIPTAYAETCVPKHPVSMLFIHGMNDGYVPYLGGYIQIGNRKRGKIISVPEAAEKWARWNGIEGQPERHPMKDPDPDDGTSYSVIRYSGGRNGSEVQTYVITGGGHTWPGGKQYLFKSLVGRTSRDFSACDVIWEFFKAHSGTKPENASR